MRSIFIFMRKVKAVIISSNSGLPYFTFQSPYSEPMKLTLLSGLIKAIQDNLGELNTSPDTQNGFSFITKGDFFILSFEENGILTSLIFQGSLDDKYYSLLKSLSSLFLELYNSLLTTSTQKFINSELFQDFSYIVKMLLLYPSFQGSMKPRNNISPSARTQLDTLPTDLKDLILACDKNKSINQLQESFNTTFACLVKNLSLLWHRNLIYFSYDLFHFDLLIPSAYAINNDLIRETVPKNFSLLRLFNGKTPIHHIFKLSKLEKEEFLRKVNDALVNDYLVVMSYENSFTIAIDFFFETLSFLLMKQIGSDAYSLLITRLEENPWWVFLSLRKDFVLELSPLFKLSILKYELPLTQFFPTFFLPLFKVIFEFLSQSRDLTVGFELFDKALLFVQEFYPNTLKHYDLEGFLKTHDLISS